MIDLRTLETFYFVAQTGGFNRAAEKLHTTQPAVSARIAQLEQDLNVRLFDRNKHGSHLTAKGRDLLRYVEQMIALRVELVSAIAGDSSLRGNLHLGVSDTIVHTWLPELLKRLSVEYPGITLEIDVDASAGLAEALLNNTIDVALMMGPVTAGHVTNVHLCSYSLDFIVRSDFPALGAGASLRKLAEYPIITFARHTRPHSELKELFRKAGATGVRLFANASLSSIIRMTLDGLGIAAIPKEVAIEHLRSGHLRLLNHRETLPVLPFTASFVPRPDMPLSGMVAKLAQEVASDGAVGSKRPSR
ncbi:LysR family transcriptional regulator [Rhizobium chutanense]|uniref:HTH-type transcriptional regulator TtuA n=1 Tax=Rhizobium chutanense TaxID=2035448 RepID=A0A432N7S3_9HYPH|nr:LysR family transcriptional regulator [Rhizobium chutanense]RUL95614.1 LysR family transcriptional regulator [Rhizobium chutanense]